MSDDRSITRWFDSLQAGNREAAQELWRHFAGRLIGLARGRLREAPRRAADEEDVVLSAFDSFCRGAEQGRFPQVQDRGDLWNLLVTITVRKASDQLQHERRQKRGGGAGIRRDRDHLHCENVEAWGGRAPRTPTMAPRHRHKLNSAVIDRRYSSRSVQHSPRGNFKPHACSGGL